MNTRPEIDLDLDLQFLPAWAREPAGVNRFAKYESAPEEERRGRRGQTRRGGDFEWGARQQRRDRPERGGGKAAPGVQGRRFERRMERKRRPQPQEAPQPEVPLPEVEVEFIPDERGVESLTKQIKLRGRAYPLFEIAKLILKTPDRYQVRFAVRRDKEGKPLQRLIVCSLDESVWLNEDEIADYIMRRHFATFYQTEKVPIDPPKGTYTFVAKCSLSGVILGAPNYHDYQTKLHRLHAERFSHIPFEVYKSKIKIVRDEAVVKQWLEEQSWRVEYTCLNVPEPLRLKTREEVEQHFRTVHLPNLVREVDEFVLGPGSKRPPMSRALHVLVRHAAEDQKRFPLKLATKLSQQFAARGLQFFKVNRAVHVSVARPHYLDLQSTVVSDNVRKIIEFITANPNCTRRQLMDALAPAPADAPPANAPAPAAPAEQPVVQTQGTQGDSATAQAAENQSVQAESPAPTPEQTAVIADLHWLIHQGHIIEFFDGHIEVAKPPKPKPQPAAMSEAKTQEQAQVQAAEQHGQSSGQAPGPEGHAAEPAQAAQPGSESKSEELPAREPGNEGSVPTVPDQSATNAVDSSGSAPEQAEPLPSLAETDESSKQSASPDQTGQQTQSEEKPGEESTAV
ncbi:MAG: hypothetical protein QHJ82_06135 [Verrucomicrobiota bacterium]|nr:hypothetical protein [Verrucomicrobiota bacterium]